ncbi:helix-turn-helix domain-containing protein [Actinoallomurus sp. CA-142502]|uniref:helix-turn-helix domain-containing protein n=1 Tax=Actinoallomurus sp. CA-142502 TaxID=3239885 RepID=UPI003D8AB446
MRRTRKPPKQPLDHEPAAVKYARDNAGLTQEQVARLCGVSRTLITEIENGTRNATPRMIGKLAAALNCPRVVLERKRQPEPAEEEYRSRGMAPVGAQAAGRPLPPPPAPSRGTVWSVPNRRERDLTQ